MNAQIQSAIETIKNITGIALVFTAATHTVQEALPASCISNKGILSQYVEEGDEITLRDADCVGLTRACTVERIHAFGTFAADRFYVFEVDSVFGPAIAVVPRGAWVEA